MKLLQKFSVYKHKINVAATGVLVLAFPGGVVAQQNLPFTQPEQGATGSLMEIFQNVANIMLFLIGAIAVIMLIVGGFRYVASGGDSNAVEGAKNTILYAIIGIVVAFLAYAAIEFLVGALGNDLEDVSSVLHSLTSIGFLGRG